LDLFKSTSDFSRLSDGTYLVSVEMSVNSTADSVVNIEAKTGLNVGSIPTKVQTAILVSPEKNKILAQAIYVNAKAVN